jgi:hypothetical protein
MLSYRAAVRTVRNITGLVRRISSVLRSGGMITNGRFGIIVALYVSIRAAAAVIDRIPLSITSSFEWGLSDASLRDVLEYV